MWTVQRVVDRLVACGVVDAGTVARRVDAKALGETLDYYGEPDDQAVLGLLDAVGLRYCTDHKTFRHSHDDGVALYARELGYVVECTGGRVTITDLEFLGGGDEDHVLRFRHDGQLAEWRILCGPDEWLDAQLTFSDRMGCLVPPGSTARWCDADPFDPDVSTDAFFGDPVALNRFGEPFGVEFEAKP